MFYYLSFLKPPPTGGALKTPIALTPQVSNDLRTESYPEAIDIFYAWTDAISGAPLTPVIKLTTWRESNAYKEISLPPPPLKRKGQASLVLSSTQTHAALEVNLRSPLCGEKPLPVHSTPIFFEASWFGKPSKQACVERVFRLFESEDSTRLRIREMTSFDLDKKLWDSGIGLSNWLVRQSLMADNGANALLTAVCEVLFSSRACCILELGAGTGVVSLVVSALRNAMRPDASTTMFATDLPSSIELMQHNVTTNLNLYPRGAPCPIILDWDDDTLPAELRGISKINLVVAADITYNTASFPALINALRLLFLHSPDTLVLFAYKQRDISERTLWDMARDQISLTFHKVEEISGAGGQAVEIWVGRTRAHYNSNKNV